MYGGESNLLLNIFVVPSYIYDGVPLTVKVFFKGGMKELASWNMSIFIRQGQRT